MRVDDFDRLRSCVFEDVNRRLFDFKGKCFCDLGIIFDKDSFVDKDGFVLVKDCSFDNFKFDSVDFDKFRFCGCSFKNSIFNECSFDSVVFESCDLSNAIFKGVRFENLGVDECELRSCVFLDCFLKYFYIRDCYCRAFKFVGCEVVDFEFRDSLLTRFDEETFIDRLVSFDKCSKDDKYKIYYNSYKFYNTIAYKFQQNNLLSFYGEYYYLSKVMERKTLRGISWVKSAALGMICGYGERPTYALITSLEIIFVFTILYMIFGLSCGVEVISYKDVFLESKSLKYIINDFITACHFSIVTFTTVGYGDVTPIGYSIFLSGIEMFLGVTMVGLWTATLARKINR